MPLLASLLLTLTPNGATAQQSPDDSFDPRVAKPAFTNTHPLVLFDAGHHNLFTATDRYMGLSRMAQSDGMQIKQNLTLLSPGVLAPARVLVLCDALSGADPMSAAAEKPAFTEAECKAVVDWVTAGGGLLLIAEHAPTGPAAMGLMRQLGVDANGGFLSDPVLQDSLIGGSTLNFTRAGKTIGDHPVTLGRGADERVNRVRTFTGQSLKGPEGSVELLRLSDQARDNMIHVGREPGPIPDSLIRSAAGRAAAVAFTLGKGRVVVLGEGAMLSAHTMKVSETRSYRVGMTAEGTDNRQFALNTLRWLGGALK